MKASKILTRLNHDLPLYSFLIKTIIGTLLLWVLLMPNSGDHVVFQCTKIKRTEVPALNFLLTRSSRMFTMF